MDMNGTSGASAEVGSRAEPADVGAGADCPTERGALDAVPEASAPGGPTRNPRRTGDTVGRSDCPSVHRGGGAPTSRNLLRSPRRRSVQRRSAAAGGVARRGRFTRRRLHPVPPVRGARPYGAGRGAGGCAARGGGRRPGTSGGPNGAPVCGTGGRAAHQDP